MEWYRVVNFIMQAVYLPFHLVLFYRLIKVYQPTPIVRWFLIVITGLWGTVSGRMLESIAYLFFPVNSFYVFSVYYQLIGTTFATAAYLIWNLYLAGHDRLAESRIFKTFLLSVSAAVCLIICTNGFHHLFYSYLVMGERVGHGKLFWLCVFLVYIMLMIGWIVSLVHIARHGKQKIKRMIVFSLYPILPAVNGLFRAITGIDELDFTPVCMAVSIYCLYLMVFRYRYVDIVSQSIESALAQTRSAMLVYDSARNEVIYTNRSAQMDYPDILKLVRPVLKREVCSIEDMYGDKNVRITVTPIAQTDFLAITVADVSDIAKERSMLEEEIVKKNTLVEELNEKKRNINAYLDILYEIPDLKSKQEMIVSAQKELTEAFLEAEQNLIAAESADGKAEDALHKNIRLTQRTIESVRAAVAALREGM